jgi:hypothetical protein
LRRLILDLDGPTLRGSLRPISEGILRRGAASHQRPNPRAAASTETKQNNTTRKRASRPQVTIRSLKEAPIIANVIKSTFTAIGEKVVGPRQRGRSVNKASAACSP